MQRIPLPTILITLLGIWLAVSTAVVLYIALTAMHPNSRAVILMGTGLILLWIVIGGTLMWANRERVHDFVLNIRGDWRIKFIVFATLLALLEEAITVTMTNLAPLFGVPVGAAYITASANYFDVVALHSVVVFVPMFIAWAWILSRWDFSPPVVFLLFGLTGTLAEVSFGGAGQFAQIGMWTFVYGLMIYLPAYCLPTERGAQPPRWWHYPSAVILPIIFSIPVVGVIGFLHPYPIHFPPIAPAAPSINF
jgi:hypothetical protein